MKRTLIAGMLGLAVAGCAHSRSDVSKETPRNLNGPVGMTPIPPLKETINRGLGDQASAKAALRDPEDARWSGQAPGPGGPSGLGAAGGTSLTQGPSQPAPPASLGGPPGPAGETPGPHDLAMPAQSGVSPSMAGTATAGSSLRGVSTQPGTGAVPEGPTDLAPPGPIGDGPAAYSPTQVGAPGTPPALSVPTTLARPGGPMPGRITQSDSMNPVASVQPSVVPGGTPEFSPASEPADPAVNPSSSVGQSASTRSTAGTAPRPMRGDPLLGPNPDLMPDLPPLPPDQAPAARSAPPAMSPPTAASPTAAQPAPTLEPAAPPDLGEPAAVPGPPSADNRPDSPTRVAEMPLPESTPASGSPETTLAAGPATTTRGATITTSRRDSSRRDTQIVKASLQKPIAEAPTSRLGPDARSADQIAAEIGNEVITLQDLGAAYREHIRNNRLDPKQISPQDSKELARVILEHLIERTLLVQEAKRVIKDTKHFDQFMEMADKYWREEEMPPMEYQHAVDNEQLLREKLKEQGISLEAMHQTFRQRFIADNFLHSKLKDRVKADLPDLRRYYSEHLEQHDFDRPAQITWHELVVEAGKYPSRDEAWKKANALYEKLSRGANFEQLARAESDGPTSSRDQGGLMQTSPGAYAVPAVNTALLSLPIGKVSEILEGENSFHIVRVDGRRPEGPATFEEVQDKIRSAILDKKFQDEKAAYVVKLRQKAYIRTMFDGIEVLPAKQAE